MMKKGFLIFLLFLGINSINSQELDCKVTVNSDKLSGSNKQVFSTLEKAISEYMNNTKWTDKNYKKQEKIKCVLTLTIAEQSGNSQYNGNIQIQVVRPVYNSTYQTPILNYKDDEVNFNYEEFQPLVFNETTFENNLISLLSFYAYTILGFDADTFALKGGDTYFKKAEQVMLTAQQGGYKGWNSLDGNKSRFQFVTDVLDGAYNNFRDVMYSYHLKGLDVMSKDKKKAKQTISNEVIKLKQIYLRRPGAFLLRIFSDTKADEIESIFKDGPQIDTRNLKLMLLRVYPANSKNWNNIK